MATSNAPTLAEILVKYRKDLLGEWLTFQRASITQRVDLMDDAELRSQSEEFLALVAAAVRTADIADITGEAWAPVRDLLTSFSRSRAAQGFTPSETATFVLSLKQPVFDRVRTELAADAEGLAAQLWDATVLLDKLALHTLEQYSKGREEIIKRQQVELLELSTPVVKMWDGVLVLPLIGTLDSARTGVIMESLLATVVSTGSGIAIIDITGVPTVDTLVAQHLLKTVAAARLMGAECIVSGIRPQIAQTMVHLGVVFGDVVTKATLADALAHAFKLMGLVVSRPQAR